MSALGEALNRLRSFVFYCGYALSVVCYAPCVLALAPFASPRGRYRLIVAWNRFAIAWVRLACGVRYRVSGLEQLPAHACVVVANHQSSWETLFLATLFPQLCIILKRELLAIPLFGWAARLLDPIAIDRDNPRAALKQLVEQGSARLADGTSVLVFPEGTRVDQGATVRFSRGAAQLAIRGGVELVCIAHDAGKYWPGRHFTKRPGEIQVRIGAPLPSTECDAGSLTRAAQEWIEAQLRDFAGADRALRESA